jgi:uridine kinase
VAVPAPDRRVVVIAGPSGSGKSRLSRRLGLPVLNLDDFYKDEDDPTLPRADLHRSPLIRTRTSVDWDDPRSWNASEAVAAIEMLCREGWADVPTYDISRSRRTGQHRLELGGSRLFLAEGIFAQEVVGACRSRGLLADAICLDQRPLVTFARRLGRDLREHRKSPAVLVRRGLRLLREQHRTVAHAEALGCRVLHPHQAHAEIRALV